MLGFVADVGIRRAIRLVAGDPRIGGHGHARIEAGDPVERGRGRRAAAKDVQRHAVRHAARYHADAAPDRAGDRIAHGIDREERAVLAHAALLLPVDVRRAVLEIAVQRPAIEVAVGAQRALEPQRRSSGLAVLVLLAVGPIERAQLAIELQRIDVVRGHVTRDRRRQEGVVAIDGDRMQSRQPATAEVADQHPAFQVLLAVDALRVDVQVVGEVVVQVRECIRAPGARQQHVQHIIQVFAAATGLHVAGIGRALVVCHGLTVGVEGDLAERGHIGRTWRGGILRIQHAID